MAIGQHHAAELQQVTVFHGRFHDRRQPRHGAQPVAGRTEAGESGQVQPSFPMVADILGIFPFGGGHVVGQRHDHARIMAGVVQRRDEDTDGQRREGGEIVEIDH